MIMNLNLLTALVCPQTGDQLCLNEGELFTEKTSYPIFGGIPWLFENPEFTFLEWGTKISAHIQQEHQLINYIRLLYKGAELDTTKLRYEKLLEAKLHNLNYITELLQMFLNQQGIRLHSSSQQVYSYFKNIFRDWCWNTNENEQYMDYIKNVAPKSARNILILGAGASKLSQLISLQYSESSVYSTDHNPFLLLTAQRIFNQKETKIFDYSFFPNRIDNTNKYYCLHENTVVNNHQFVFASFPNLPFPKNFFDLIVAPWFFDILDFDLKQSLEATIDYIRPEGRLIHIGPSNIHHRDLDKQYCDKEIAELYHKTFDKVTFETCQIDYLKSPIESHLRKENVLFLSANNKKSSIVKNTKALPTIKFSPALQNHKALMVTKARFLNLINQDLTCSEFAEKIKNEFNLEQVEAEFYAESFIKNLNNEL